MTVVIDTNVLVVANGRHEPASDDCVLACIDALSQAREGRVLVDEQQEILDEYRNHCSHSGQPGLGDAFFKWLHNNQANPARCERVKITPHPTRKFEEFPEDPDLASFDLSDRKFVAVALANQEEPPILNASDTDWWHVREALERNGVTVCFLCRELMVAKSRK